MLRERIESYIDNLDTCDLVVLWDNYCNETCCYDDEIRFMDELNDYFCSATPLEILNAVSSDFNANHDYFKYGIYGVESFDYARDEMDIETLIDYIVENHFYGDDDELKEILDSEDDDDIDEI